MLITCLKCNRHVESGQASPGEIVTCSCGMGIMVPEGPAAAGKMNCPACGAPVDPDLKQCVYCNTRLATVMCPSCFGVVFERSKHCSQCGETLSERMVIHHGDETEHLCPRCEAHPPLRVEVVAGCPLERCQDCEGLWIDKETVERIYKDRERSETVSQMTASKEAGPQTQEIQLETVRYIKCPDCDKMMNRKNFGRCSGVIIDICKDHGSWFDADELRKIVEFIASGGLDKAAEREKMELKEEIRWLRQKRRMDATTEGMRVSASGGGARLASEGFALGIGGLLRGLFR